MGPRKKGEIELNFVRLKSIFNFIIFSVLLILFYSIPISANADIFMIIIDEKILPYNLSPDNYDNSPSKYDNSSSKYENSSDNYENSASKYENSPAKFENGISGNRRIISAENEFIGYYVYNDKGILNFYNTSGARVAFMPAGGQTTSVFMDDAWCGTLGTKDGNTVIGVSIKCYYKFILENGLK